MGDFEATDRMHPSTQTSTCPAHTGGATAEDERATALARRPISRRRALQLGARGAGAAATLGLVGALAWQPRRVAQARAVALPDVQFDIGNYIAPAQTMDGVLVRFGPVFTTFTTLALRRTPTKADQHTLAHALETIEAHYAFNPSGVFTFVAYGIPYFKRLPGGMHGPLVARYMPRLLADHGRYALEEAIPAPTDVHPANPGIAKKTFTVPVRIEANDLLLTLRSDVPGNILDVLLWLRGSDRLNGRRVPSPAFAGLFHVTSSRIMFQQNGLPRLLADSVGLPYARTINPQSPMWMGFADQQVSGAGPASIVTFQGNASARFTTARAGDYFANGAIQHLSHDIQDLAQFYANPDEPFTERCQYMFRSNPIPATGNADQFANGGGPAFLENVFQGTDDALRNAEGLNTFGGEHRMGHLPALQRSSRAQDGTPVHIRMDGAGYDNLDVPDGSNQPKLQFTAFVPTGDFFNTMRKNQASLDLVEKYGVAEEDNGLERFITATRRQNFLVPPRQRRAFPLLELA